MSVFSWIMGLSDTYMPLIALIIYLVFKKDIPGYERSLFIYIVVSLLIFASTNILAYQKAYNLFLYHFFTLFEFALVTWYILVVLMRKKRNPVYYFAAVYFLYWVINILFWEPLTVFNSNSSCIANLTILFFSMYYLIQLSKGDEILNFQKLPSFWIVSGFLISSAISVMGVIVYKYYQFNLSLEEMDTGLKIWLLTVAGNIIKFILIIFGLLCYKRRRSNSTSRYLFP